MQDAHANFLRHVANEAFIDLPTSLSPIQVKKILTMMNTHSENLLFIPNKNFQNLEGTRYLEEAVLYLSTLLKHCKEAISIDTAMKCIGALSYVIKTLTELLFGPIYRFVKEKVHLVLSCICLGTAIIFVIMKKTWELITPATKDALIYLNQIWAKLLDRFTKESVKNTTDKIEEIVRNKTDTLNEKIKEVCAEGSMICDVMNMKAHNPEHNLQIRT